MDLLTERAYAMVSMTASSADLIGYDVLTAQPPALTLPPLQLGITGGGVSNPMLTMLELVRRCFTNITTPSTTVISGTAAGADTARRRYPGACREADGRRRKNRLEDIVKRSGDAGGIPEAVVERAGLPRQLRGRDAGAFGRQRVGRSAAQELIRHIVMTGVPCG